MASLTLYGTPKTQVPSMDFSRDGMFTSKTYHGLSLVIDGNVIGRIQNWSPAARTRTVTHKWELSANAFGRPVDLIPSKADGYNISIGRTEVWSQELEMVCGYGSVWRDLMEQNYPFVFTEQLYHGSDLYRSWDYPSCWFTSYSEEGATVDGDGAYVVTGEIAHMPRIRNK